MKQTTLANILVTLRNGATFTSDPVRIAKRAAGIAWRKAARDAMAVGRAYSMINS